MIRYNETERVTHWTTLLYLIGCFGIFKINHLSYFYPLYAMVGVAAAAYTSVGNAMLKDLFSQTRLAQAIAAIGVVMACGPALGATLGTTLTHWLSWRAVLLFLGGYGFYLFISLITIVPETKHNTPASTQPFCSVVTGILTNPQFIVPIIVLAMAFGCIMAYLSVAPFIFKVFLGYSTYASGWLLMLSSIPYLIGALMVVLFVNRCSIPTLITIALPILVVSEMTFLCLALLPTPHPWIIISIISSLVFALGMLVPLSKAACMLTATEHSGTTASLMKFCQTVGAIVMTLIAAALNSEQSIVPFSCLLLAVTAIAILIVLFTLKSSPLQPQELP